MVIFTISNFATFAGLLVAATKLASDPNLTNKLKALADLASSAKTLAAVLDGANLALLARQMETSARDTDAAFDSDLAAEDARRIFWQVAPAALADRALMTASALDARDAADAMIKAIRASSGGADFARTPMAERYFQEVARATLAAMFDSAQFIADITPDLWRQVLRDNGIQIELLERIDAKIDALPDEIVTRVVAELDRRGKAAAAHRMGVSDERIIELARRIDADVSDPERALGCALINGYRVWEIADSLLGKWRAACPNDATS